MHTSMCIARTHALTHQPSNGREKKEKKKNPCSQSQMNDFVFQKNAPAMGKIYDDVANAESIFKRKMYA